MPREIVSERLSTAHIEAELSTLTGAGTLAGWKRAKAWSRQRSWVLQWPSGHRRTWGAGKVAAYIRGIREGGTS